MQIALALYAKFTALDIVGPFQALADVPGHEVEFVAGAAGQVVDHTGRCPLLATATFADVTEYDPRPPFDAGSPSKAPADVVELAAAALAVPASVAPNRG